MLMMKIMKVDMINDEKVMGVFNFKDRSKMIVKKSMMLEMERRGNEVKVVS